MEGVQRSAAVHDQNKARQDNGKEEIVRGCVCRLQHCCGLAAVKRRRVEEWRQLQLRKAVEQAGKSMNRE